MAVPGHAERRLVNRHTALAATLRPRYVQMGGLKPLARGLVPDEPAEGRAGSTRRLLGTGSKLYSQQEMRSPSPLHISTRR